MNLDAGDVFVILLLIAIAAWFFFRARRKKAMLAAMTPDERDAHLAALATNKQARATEKQGAIDTLRHGILKPEIICPHCQVKGYVHTKSVNRKKGVSGGKATGAILTLGWSLLATGLSRKERVTEAWCGNCKAEWTL
jgi:ABC-type nickel/cobalt efflux system permease component RcnA